jgi:NADPH-ferrihemoprotein reductase
MKNLWKCLFCSGNSAADEETEIEFREASTLPIHIFFGSETGTASTFANILKQEAENEGLNAQIVDLENFHPDSFLQVRLGFFMVATRGEGDPTDNAIKFTEWLTSPERSKNTLKKLKFTIFGLGNREYDIFCGQGKRVNEQLEKLGAERIFPYGEGDANANMEEDFNTWKKNIWGVFKRRFNIIDSPFKNQMRMANQPPPYLIKIEKSQNMDAHTISANRDGKKYDFHAKQYLASSSCKVTSLKELRQNPSEGSTLHIEIDCGTLAYRTAQNLHVFPENCPEKVKKIANLLKVDLDDSITLSQIEENSQLPFPSPISVKTYLTKFCDFSGLIRKKQLQEIAKFCKDEKLRSHLVFLTTDEGQSEFNEKIYTQMKGLLDIIVEYEIAMPFENLILMSSVIQPRIYTIASSSKKFPNSIHLCLTLHALTSLDGQTQHGLSSSFFSRLYNDQLQGRELPKINISVKDSTFLLPTEPQIPIIMVAAGSGIAPFKGFLEEQTYFTEKNPTNKFGQMVLFFGCRKKDSDYLYKETFEKYCQTKLLDDFHVAFSREKDKKCYVQDMVERNGELVMNLLFKQKGTLYVCGSGHMGKDLTRVLSQLVSTFFKISLEEGTNKIKELESNKTIIKEVWS